MNLNILSYGIYAVFSIIITVLVGRSLYRQGRIYLLYMMKGNDHLTDAINNILIVGYYLLNIGGSIAIIYYWSEIRDITQLIEKLAIHMAIVMSGMGYIHLTNLIWIKLIRKNKYS